MHLNCMNKTLASIFWNVSLYLIVNNDLWVGFCTGNIKVREFYFWLREKDQAKMNPIKLTCCIWKLFPKLNIILTKRCLH